MYVTVKLYREIKAFCPDFRPIRKLLRELGATPLGQKEQMVGYGNPTAGGQDRALALSLHAPADSREIGEVSSWKP